MKLASEFDFLFSIQNYSRLMRFMESDEGSILARCKIDEDYQRMTIEIYPCFWAKSVSEQRSTILHEFIHIWFEPLVLEATKAINDQFVNKESIRRALERGVSSAESVLDRLFVGKLRYARKAYTRYKETKKK